MKAFATVLAAIALSACATASPRIQLTAAAGDEALTCGDAALRELGYDVKRLGPAQVEANRVEQIAPGEANRDVIAFSVTASPASRIDLSVSRWLYQPSMHSLPSERQSIHEVAPADEVIADAQAVLERCEA